MGYIQAGTICRTSMETDCEFCAQNSSTTFTCQSVCSSPSVTFLFLIQTLSSRNLSQSTLVHRTLNRIDISRTFLAQFDLVLLNNFHQQISTSTFPPWSSWSPWFINGSIVSLSYQINLEFAQITLVLLYIYINIERGNHTFYFTSCFRHSACLSVLAFVFVPVPV